MVQEVGLVWSGDQFMGYQVYNIPYSQHVPSTKVCYCVL